MADGFRCDRSWTISTRLGRKKKVRCLCQETNHNGEEIDDLPPRDAKIVRECNRRGGYKMPQEEKEYRREYKKEHGHFPEEEPVDTYISI